ncbi:UNVERIFIED_CONTAM: Retrovirus-related Pol polyprotein from transposon RE2 [Sesamum indicum]
MGFINGSFPKPTKNQEEIEQWERVNCMVVSWLLSSMNKEIAEAFIYTTSAQDLWEQVEARFGESNGPMLYDIQKKISSSVQGDRTVSEYFTKLKKLWDELAHLDPLPTCSCGASKAMSDTNSSRQLIQFLMGLEEGYDHIRSQILLMEPLPTIGKAYSMVLRIEKQRNINLEAAQDGAMAVRSVNYKRDQINTVAQKRKPALDKKSQYCDFCKRNGHTRQSCFKLVGFPDWYKSLIEQKRGEKWSADKAFNTEIEESLQDSFSASQTDITKLIRSEVKKVIQKEKDHHDHSSNMANVEDYAGNTIFHEPWIIDSGASNHMCGDLQILKDLKRLKTSIFVKLPDGTRKEVTYKGMVQLTLEIVLHEVLYIPDFRHNLLSVRKLCIDSGLKIIFTKNQCILQELQTMKTMAMGRLVGKLYVLNNENCKFAATIEQSRKDLNMHCMKATSSDIDLWHRRLGHTSVDVLKHIPSINKNKSVLSLCDICPMAKMHRLPFSSSDTHAVDIFDLVHMDVWGPYKQFSISNSHYMLTIVDDHSRATWIYLMTYKDQVVQKIETFFNMVHNQFNKRIKIIRTDNGTEFTSQKCQLFIQKHGILHQRTCVFTPQQNGIVERKHQHLLQLARALLFQAKMPLKFWTEAILTAAYLINRLPTLVLNWKTPFEILFKKPASYAHLRTFGCLCYASNNLPNKKKFDSRSYKCVFLGYGHGQKGYKVYDLASQSIFVTRDLVFHENYFPFESITSDNLACPLPIVPIDSDVFTNKEKESDININEEPDIHTDDTQIRRSSRQTSKPVWMKDFVCDFSYDTMPTHITAFTPTYGCFVQALSILQEPKSFREAQQKQEWREAMKSEIFALEHNETWDLVKAPLNKKCIGCRWIYKLKLKPDGTIERYKARLVAKGYNQVEGQDYTDCFAPVAKAVTVRIFLAVSVARGWSIHHFDVNNAFLHGSLQEDIYMEPPEGFEVEPGYVCKLKKALYGLKQASREWNKKFTENMQGLGFKQSCHDYCLFTKNVKDGQVLLLVYVDDILVSAPSLDYINEVQHCMNNLFTIKNLGIAKYFLGIELAQAPEGLLATQNKYTADIIQDMGLTHATSKNTPLPTGIKLSSNDSEPLPEPSRYRRLIGRLLYLNFTRPDITYGVQQLSQFLHKPCQIHWDAAVHLVKYLKGAPATGIFFSSNNTLNLTAFCDADWGGCTETRKSLTGFSIFLGNTPISWKSKKQVTVSRSTAEAEYRSLATTVCELMWIDYLLQDFQVLVPKPIPLYCDNKAAVYISVNPVFHERTKHIDIDCHIVRNKFKEGFVLPSHISAKEQVADILTKALSAPAFNSMKSKLNLLAWPPGSTCGGDVKISKLIGSRAETG